MAPHCFGLLLAAFAAAPSLATKSTASGPVEVPIAWQAVGSPPRDHRIELIFGVKQQHVEQLHSELMRVSDPRSPDYGAHLSNEAVHTLTAPAPQHSAAVLGFLREHGIEGVSATPNGDMISAVVSVGVAERLLSSSYVRLQHRGTGTVVHRTPGGYQLPEAVAAAVDFVAPTTHIPGIPVRHTKLSAAQEQNNVPKTLRQLYSVDAEGKAPENKQAVTAFLEQYYSVEALNSYWNQYCSGIACGKGLPKLVGDATTGSSPGVESMLDIEAITGVAGNVESEFWGFKGRSPDNPENEPFMKWLAMVSSTSDDALPKLFSTSYGEDESSWSYAAAARLNTEFMKAGARGVTLLFASGDNGANCKSSTYEPNTPASSPYVTAVGGTQPTGDFPNPGSEEAIGLSSGGFSNYWPMPDWQKDAVAEYLKQPNLPPASRGYNTSGRGFPDIAAQATNFCVTPFGCGVAGTSCASPTVAGVIGLLNDVRLQNGKSSLGFLNPLLYSQLKETVHDITSGEGQGCGFESGWPATKGWDAVTGLGTPNYKRMAEVVLGLPAGKGPKKTSSTVVV